MNDIERIGGWSAILFGIAMLVAFGLFIPTFTAMPAEAMQPENYAARLAAMDSMGSAQRAALALGFGLEIVAGLLMFPAFLAMHGATRSKSEARAALAVGMAALAIPFLTLAPFSGLSLLQLSNGFGVLDEMTQAARAAMHGYSGDLGLHLERLFWLFFVWAAALWLGLMRDTTFPRWLAWLGLAAAIVGVISMVGGLIVAALEPLSVLATLLLIVWFIGVGVSLLRSSRAAR